MTPNHASLSQKHGGQTILFFDSGIGGLSVVKEARVLLPNYRYIYVADDAAFPYGGWEEPALLQRITTLFEGLIMRYSPALIVIACNTASTLTIEHLRKTFPTQPFVGTVPAIKPAAERTNSGLVSILATPGTVKRQYTRDLIRAYASKCHVRLVGSEHLAQLSEEYMRSGFVNEEAVAREIAPCFITQENSRTDIVVLACTHYPFLVNRMRKMAPWPVDWIDSCEAIARRALFVMQDDGQVSLEQSPVQGRAENLSREHNFSNDIAIFTSKSLDNNIAHLMRGFGFNVQKKY